MIFGQVVVATNFRFFHSVVVVVLKGDRDIEKQNVLKRWWVW